MVMNIWNFDETMAAFVDDWIDAVHTEELNGKNILVASLPITHDKASLLIEGNYLGFYDNDSAYQMFEILEVNENHSTVEVLCEHVLAELNSEIVEDSRPYNQTAETALGLALASTRWTEGTVADLGLNSANFYYESARSAIAKIINTWGGELRCRLVLSGNTITHRYVDILETRGSVTGKRFEYGKDIKDIYRQVSTDGLITACYGRGKGEEVGTNDDGKTTYGRRLTFADVVWATPGDEANKPATQEWVGDDTAKGLYGYADGTRHRYGVFTDDEETDDETLLENTWAYLQANNSPKVTYDLDVLLLESLSGYSHEAVRLGDTVVIADTELAIALSARVIKFERDLLTPENSKIRLGNYIDAFSGTVLDTITHIDRYRDRQAFYDDGSTRATDGLDDSGYVDLPVYGQKIVGTAAEDGLNMTNTHMGYYNDSQTAWRAYIDNHGQFLFQKDANNYFMYDGTNFEFKGPVIVTGGDATKTFTAEPTTPYKVGDLWTQGDSGDLKVCETARASGAYVAGDWVLASEYTKGADWSANLSNIPGTLGTPSGTGLFLSGTYLGYYDAPSWKTYMDNTGKFYLGGTSGKLQWDGTDLAIEGSITITGGSGIASLTDAGGLATADNVDFATEVAGEEKPANNATVGADWSSNLTNIPATLESPLDAGDNGLHLTSTYLGYYSHPNWSVFIKNDGTFLFQKDANNYFEFDGTNFTFRGPLIADDVTTGTLSSTDGSTYFNLSDAEIKLTATVNGNDSVITLNPTVGFEITTNGLPIYETGKYPIKTQAHFASGQCILGTSDTEVFFANELEDIPDAIVLTPINDDTAICTAMTYLLSATSFHAYASSGCAAFYMAMVNSKTYFYRMEISDSNWVVGDSNGNYSQNNTSAYLYLNGYADVGVEGRATYVLDVPVDLTYFKTLYVEWENTGTASDYNFSYLNVASTEQGDYNDNIIGGIDLTNTFSKKISTLNISAMNDTYYIRAHARAITDSITSEIKVYRIWAE